MARASRKGIGAAGAAARTNPASQGAAAGAAAARSRSSQPQPQPQAPSAAGRNAPPSTGHQAHQNQAPEEEEVLPEERSSPAPAAGQQHRSGRHRASARSKQRGPARVCRSHGSQLPRRERQRGRRSRLDHSDHQQRPRQLLSGRCTRRPRLRLPCATTRPRASSASSTTCSSRPRSRRQPANSASRSSS